ncbi:MAG: hypothetical protein JNN07_06050 [Verrucomicrobiales bacterium]|nr:hypothetical protein [Verrucomicrobiales bacterium]
MWAFFAAFGLLSSGRSLLGDSTPEIVLQRGHYGEVGAVAYSPDGRIIASAGPADDIRLWDRATGDLVRALPGHPERVMGLVFSPDGKWLASAGTEGTVKLWDYDAGRLAHLLTNHVGDWVRRIAFSPDSRLLVPASYDGKMSVWDVASGAVSRTLSTDGSVSDVVFTPDGKSIVTLLRRGASKSVVFWDAATGAPGLTLDSGVVMSGVAVANDGSRLAAGGLDGLLIVWELPSGRVLHRLMAPEKEQILDIDFSPDGALLAAAGAVTNTVWSTETGRMVSQLLGHEDNTMHINFSPDGQEIATGSSDSSIRLWNAHNGTIKRIFPRRAPNTPVTSVAFSRDGRFEAISTADGRVRTWDAEDGRFLHELDGHEEAVQVVVFGEDSRWLFSGSVDRTVRVWDMHRGTLSANKAAFDRVDTMGAIAVGGTENLMATAPGPTASASLDYSIKLWESHDAWPRLVLTGHVASVRSVAFNPGVDLLASASLDGSLKLWSTASGDCLRTATNTVLPEVVVFSSESRWLIAGMADGTLRVLDTNALLVAREWHAHHRPVQSLAISADGRFLASASADRTVALWEFESGRELRRFTNVTSHHLPLAFHPKRPVLVYAPRDDLVIHVDMDSGEILFQRVLFANGEWLAWNPAKAFHMSSPRGGDRARLRLAGQLAPVYPLELYRYELSRPTDLLKALAGPAPVLVPKDFRLWWHRYPHKRAWLYGGCALVLIWVITRLRRGWIAERRRRSQEALSRQLLVSQEAERKRIAAELHDSLGQNLLIIKNQLYLAQRKMPAESALQLDEISQSVSQSLTEVREISHNLRPYQLDRLGLTKALESVVTKVADSGSLRVESQFADIDGLFSPEGEINIFRIVQESFNNILKHSEAATVSFSIARVANQVRIRIDDDGRGFDYRRATSNRDGARGCGLASLSERVRILRGSFLCDSAPSQGTRLTFEIPVPSERK